MLFCCWCVAEMSVRWRKERKEEGRKERMDGREVGRKDG